MRKIKLYIASSIDGKIARENGDVSWLNEVPNPDKNDYGYNALMQSIDTTIMGYSTYEQVHGFDCEFPYKGLTNYVLTTKVGRAKDDFATFVSGDVISFIQNLKEGAGKDIWLIGGGKINALLLNNGLIDEMQIFIMPVVLGNGIAMFDSNANFQSMHLKDSITYKSGVVQLNYLST